VVFHAYIIPQYLGSCQALFLGKGSSSGPSPSLRATVDASARAASANDLSGQSGLLHNVLNFLRSERGLFRLLYCFLHCYIRHHSELFCKHFFNLFPVGQSGPLFVTLRSTVMYASYFLSIEPIEGLPPQLPVAVHVSPHNTL